MADEPRRYTTQVESNSGRVTFQVTSLTLPDGAVGAVLAELRQRELLGRAVSSGSCRGDLWAGDRACELGPERYAIVARRIEARTRTSYRPPAVQWNATPVIDYFAEFNQEAAVVARATLNQGRVVVEESPARIRRLVSVYMLGGWIVLHTQQPLILMASAGGLYMLNIAVRFVDCGNGRHDGSHTRWRKGRRPRHSTSTR